MKPGIPEEECVVLAAKLEEYVSKVSSTRGKKKKITLIEFHQADTQVPKVLPRKPPLPGEPNDLHSSPMPYPRVVVTYVPTTPRCHLSFNYPEKLDPNLGAFECLDEVEWFGTLPPIRDAGLTA